MYQTDKTNYGYKLTFGGIIEADEMNQWVNDVEQKLNGQSGDFGVFVDMRTLQPLPQDVQPIMQKGQKLFKDKGMQRSVVILEDDLTTMQFRRIAKETGIYQWERYLSASKNPDWEKSGLAWINDSVDPDA
jgi:hypothetical protein